MEFRDILTDAQMKTMNFVHRAVLMVSGGRLGNNLGSMQVVQLRHAGRTSGKSYSTMLTAPIVEDGTYVLVASKGGDDRDPQWYRNIVAEPEIELVVGDDVLPMTARTASDEEKAELWPKITATYKGYAGYQNKTERNIPVVICEPRS
jgi:deazaflavin-dependent oxidoreductase (nitroreductase family)